MDHCLFETAHSKRCANCKKLQELGRMKWDRGWHGQEKRSIGVDEAIDIRDDPTLKTGDLFCCSCENIRLSPVNAVTRVRHLRQHPKHRKVSKRGPCEVIKKSREKGESWKHSRVVDAIIYYLENDAKNSLCIEDVKRGDSREDPDIIVTHSEVLDGFDGTKSYIIVPMQNLRRSRDLFSRFAPNSVAVEIHRWRDKDVDFTEYIRNRVNRGYNDRSGGNYNPEFLHSSAGVPNLGVYTGKTGGLGRGMVLPISSDVDEDSEEFEVLQELEGLIDAVESHNLWAVSTPGKHRYHLKNLKLEPFIGDGVHEDASIDAFLSIYRRLDVEGNQGLKRKNWFLEIAADEDEGRAELEFLKTQKIIEERLEKEIADGADWAANIDDDTMAEIMEEAREKFDENLQDAEEGLKENKERIKQFTEAIIQQIENALKDLFDRGWYDEESREIVTPWGNHKFDWENEGNSGTHLRLAEMVLSFQVPEIHFWSKLSDDEKHEAMKKVRKTYRKMTFFRGHPIHRGSHLLCGLSVGEHPLRLTDLNGIEDLTWNWKAGDDDEFKPITHLEFLQLSYFIAAEADFSFPDGKHHSFATLIDDYRHSTDHITKQVVLNLPQPIEDLLNKGDGSISDRILDILSNHLEDYTEEE